MGHAQYLKDAAELAATLPDMNPETLKRVEQHLQQGWLEHTCEQCNSEAETEKFPAQELALWEAESHYIAGKFPGEQVGLMKVRHGFPLGRVSRMLEGKRLSERRRRADRESAPLFWAMQAERLEEERRRN